MTDLELFELWCKHIIEVEKEKREIMELDPSIPKWKIAKEFIKSPLFECEASLKMLEKFKNS